MLLSVVEPLQLTGMYEKRFVSSSYKILLGNSTLC